MSRALVIAVLFLVVPPAWADSADTWYPSKYGAEDTLGAINELSPEKVLAAAKLVKLGETYALGVETGRDTPAYGARSFELFAVAAGDGSGATMGENKATFNDDWMLTWLGIGTQIDGLGHFGIDHRYYNGNTITDIFAPEGLKKFATHALPPIVTRGIVLDMAGQASTDVMAEGTLITVEDLQGALDTTGLTLAEGDVVLLHTGWLDLIGSEPDRFAAGEPGIDGAGAAWLAEQGVVAVGADTWGLDAVPHPDGLVFPAHQELLAKNGVYILENMATGQLVEDGVTEFMFVLGQPRFEGAVQSMINPVAIR